MAITSTEAANQISSLQARGLGARAQQPCENAVKAKRTECVSAGKTIRVRRHAEICSGPRAMVDVFERQVERQRTRHGH